MRRFKTIQANRIILDLLLDLRPEKPRRFGLKSLGRNQIGKNHRPRSVDISRAYWFPNSHQQFNVISVGSLTRMECYEICTFVDYSDTESYSLGSCAVSAPNIDETWCHTLRTGGNWCWSSYNRAAWRIVEDTRVSPVYSSWPGRRRTHIDESRSWNRARTRLVMQFPCKFDFTKK